MLEARLGTGLEILFEGESVGAAGSSSIVAAKKGGLESHCFSRQNQHLVITIAIWMLPFSRNTSKISANIPRFISRGTISKINPSFRYG